MSDTTQIERQLHILSLLSNDRNGYTASDISDHLLNAGIEVSKKTIERDIDSLSMVHFPVVEEKRGKYTYFYAHKFGLDKISFTISELVSLYLIREMLKSYSLIDIGVDALHLIEKIISQLPTISQEYIDGLKELIAINPLEVINEKSINPFFMEQIRNGVSLRKKIWINYYAFNTEEYTERIIDPYFLEIHDGCYHLIAFCNLRTNIREFRVSRIREIKILDESFVKPAGVYEKYQKNKFNKLSGEKRIVLRLRFTGATARYVKEYESKKADKLTDIENGIVLFEKSTTMTPEILKWVLGFGGEVEVLEPVELREQVKEEAKNILEKYFTK